MFECWCSSVDVQGCSDTSCRSGVAEENDRLIRTHQAPERRRPFPLSHLQGFLNSSFAVFIFLPFLSATIQGTSPSEGTVSEVRCRTEPDRATYKYGSQNCYNNLTDNFGHHVHDHIDNHRNTSFERTP